MNGAAVKKRGGAYKNTNEWLSKNGTWRKKLRKLKIRKQLLLLWFNKWSLLYFSIPSLLVTFLHYIKIKVLNWNGFTFVQTLQRIYTTHVLHQGLGSQSEETFLDCILCFRHCVSLWIKLSALSSEVSVVINTQRSEISEMSS